MFGDGWIFPRWLLGTWDSTVLAFCHDRVRTSSSRQPACRTGQCEAAQPQQRIFILLQAKATFMQAHFMLTWGTHPYWRETVLRGFCNAIPDSFWRGSSAVIINPAGLNICLKHVAGPSGFEASLKLGIVPGSTFHRTCQQSKCVGLERLHA